MRVALVDSLGVIQDETTVPTNVQGGVEAVISDLLKSIRQLQSHTGTQAKAIGLAVAGQIDANTGMIKFAPNLYWHNVPMASIVGEALHLPVVIANDVRAATFGEMRFGAGRGAEDIVCVFFGTGIGGGVVSKGTLICGHNNSAGEVGHMVLNIGGNLCSCGNRGCWETLAGGWAISKMVKEAIEQNPLRESKILSLAKGDIDSIMASHLFQAAREEDALALELTHAVKEAMIAGNVSLLNAFNPEVLILGGGLIDRDPWLVKEIHRGIINCALKSAVEKLTVKGTELGSDAAVLGIAIMALEAVL